MKRRQFLALAAGAAGVGGAATVAGCLRGKPDAREAAADERQERRRRSWRGRASCARRTASPWTWSPCRS
jgi:hypothetical protein